jgi:NAD(P)-dependent dehydrogenase (short-subunit alcohol dehydrogenase family)
MSQRLQGKVAVVTGSTSGIGRATAVLFAQEGAQIVVNGRRKELGEQVVEEIRTGGGEATFFQADLFQSEQVRALVRFAAETYGRIDILFNNAISSAPGRGGSVVEMDEAVWDGAMNVGLKAIFLACKEAIPIMLSNGGGVILNTASVHGLLASHRAPAYDTLKAGVINLTRQIAVDFGHQGIRCNALCPGLIIVERWHERFRDHPEQMRQAETIYPVGRPGYPIDVAKAALFLASDDASFITGHALVVDGGLTIQLQDSLTYLVENTLRERGWRW